MTLDEYDTLNDDTVKLKAIEAIPRAFQADTANGNYSINLDLSMQFLADQLSGISETIDEMLSNFHQE